MASDYDNGRWATGSRPLTPGKAQSDYDAGAQDRRFDEERRMREQRDYYDRQQKEQRERQEKERRKNAERYSNKPQQKASEQDNQPRLHRTDDPTFDDIMILAATAGVVFLMVRLWGMATGSLNPSNAILAGIVDYGAWGVGLAGIGLSIRFQETLLPIAKVVLAIAVVAAVLFFGSAIVVGVYQGITN